jgi:hypothetical protein
MRAAGFEPTTFGSGGHGIATVEYRLYRLRLEREDPLTLPRFNRGVSESADLASPSAQNP